MEKESLWFMVRCDFLILLVVKNTHLELPCVISDVASAPQGNVGLRAFRLTPEFIETYRGGKFDTARFVPSFHFEKRLSLIVTFSRMSYQLNRTQTCPLYHSTRAPRHSALHGSPHRLPQYSPPINSHLRSSDSPNFISRLLPHITLNLARNSPSSSLHPLIPISSISS